jgi:hypothetical protein
MTNFPLINWLSQYTKIRSSEGEDNIYADCPFCHGQSTLAASRDNYHFRCFRCYEGGHCRDIWEGQCWLPKMIMLLERVSYHEAKRRVERFVGVTLPKPTEQREEHWPREMFKIKNCSNMNPGKLMLERRKVEHLAEHSYYIVNGHYADRVLLTTQWFGKTTGFEAKACYPVQSPKALYPSWFRTGENLYGTREWDWKLDFAVITESILDAETLGSNSVGLFGSSLKAGQLKLLLELRKRGLRRLVWLLDADAIKKAIGIIFKETNLWFTNYIAPLAGKEDPNSIGRDRSWEAVSRAQEVNSELELLPYFL